MIRAPQPILEEGEEGVVRGVRWGNEAPRGLGWGSTRRISPGGGRDVRIEPGGGTLRGSGRDVQCSFVWRSARLVEMACVGA